MSITIDSHLGEAAFDPDAIDILAAAFDAAWESLQTSNSPFAADGKASSTRQLLAKRIIEMGRDRGREPLTLMNDALAYLGNSS